MVTNNDKNGICLPTITTLVKLHGIKVPIIFFAEVYDGPVFTRGPRQKREEVYIK